MTNRQAFHGLQSDGQDQRAIPLRVPEQIPVSSVANGNAIALLLNQPNGEHECQWGVTSEQAEHLIEMLQNARYHMACRDPDDVPRPEGETEQPAD